MLTRDHGSEHTVAASMELRFPTNWRAEINCPFLRLPKQFAQDEQFASAGGRQNGLGTQREVPIGVQTMGLDGECSDVFLFQLFDLLWQFCFARICLSPQLFR